MYKLYIACIFLYQFSHQRIIILIVRIYILYLIKIKIILYSLNLYQSPNNYLIPPMQNIKLSHFN